MLDNRLARGRRHTPFLETGEPGTVGTLNARKQEVSQGRKAHIHNARN